MSKFNVGDRVRKVNNEYLHLFEIGEELIVVGIVDATGRAKVAREKNQNNWDTAYDSDIELIQPSDTDTITLTRYIKPATIEINGVEYLMPEKNNAT